MNSVMVNYSFSCSIKGAQSGSTIQLVDPTGKLISTRQVKHGNPETFNATQLRAGSYFIRVVSSTQGTHLVRIVKP